MDSKYLQRTCEKDTQIYEDGVKYDFENIIIIELDLIKSIVGADNTRLIGDSTKLPILSTEKFTNLKKKLNIEEFKKKSSLKI